MKNFLLFLSFLLLLSCSVQKRKYQSGYYVDWHQKKSTKETQVAKQQSNPKLKDKAASEEVSISSGDKDPNLQAANQKHGFLSKKKKSVFQSPPDSCDVIIFKDGSEIQGKVEEVGITDIKYKRCDSPKGPVYVSRKSEIFMIKYVNGTKEVIKSEPTVSPYQAPTQAPQVNTYKANKYKRVNHPAALPAIIFGGASILSAYIILLYSIDIGLTSSAILFLPLILGIIAIACGVTANNAIRSQPDVYKGKGMSIPGLIMGIVIVSIMALILITITFI